MVYYAYYQFYIAGFVVYTYKKVSQLFRLYDTRLANAVSSCFIGYWQYFPHARPGKIHARERKGRKEALNLSRLLHSTVLAERNHFLALCIPQVSVYGFQTLPKVNGVGMLFKHRVFAVAGRQVVVRYSRA